MLMIWVMTGNSSLKHVLSNQWGRDYMKWIEISLLYLRHNPLKPVKMTKMMNCRNQQLIQNISFEELFRTVLMLLIFSAKKGRKTFCKYTVRIITKH